MGELTVELIARLAATATSITVISAFYDIAFLRMLALAVPSGRRPKVSLQVYLHGFSGRRLRGQLTELKKLNTRWKRSFKSADVSLVSKGALFHSKLLIFRHPKSTTALVGSANATLAAYEDNEEVMVRFDGVVPRSMQAYIDLVKGASQPLSDVREPEVASLVAFFRSGAMYYRPSVASSFRFNLQLPPALLDRIAVVRLPIGGLTAKAGDLYNPFAGIGLTAEEVSALDDESLKGQSAAANKVPMRPYGVQTCYGWWVPGAYQKGVQAHIDRASSARESLLKRLSKKLAGNASDVRNVAAVSFAAIEAFAAGEQVALEESSDKRNLRFDAFLDRCRDRLDNIEWRNRASKSYIQTSVPELWTDPVSSQEFSDSFFGYLEFVAAAGKKPLIWTSVRDAVSEIDEGDSMEQIRTKLAKRLRKGWSDDLWKMPEKGGAPEGK